MTQFDVYRDVFRDRFGLKTWMPVWRPGANLRLGMAGRIVSDQFVYEYDLADRGLDAPKLAPRDPSPDDYDWSTEGGVQISVKASGKTDEAFKDLATADAGFKLSFTRSQAMALVYRGVVETSFGDQRALAEQMVASWNGGPWPKMQLGDVAITSLLVASWGFAFGAATQGAEVVIRADAQVGAEGTSIAAIKGRIGVAWQKHTSMSSLSPDGLVIGMRGLELAQKGLVNRRTIAKPVLEGLGEQDGDIVLAREEFGGDWPA